MCDFNVRLEMHNQRTAAAPGIRIALTSVTFLLACLAELLLWVSGAMYLYWQIPESVDAIRSHGFEIPRSMVRVINVTDVIASLSLGAVPFILGVVMIPKATVFAATPSSLKRGTVIVIGWAIPVLLVIYGAGIPKMIDLGIWP